MQEAKKNLYDTIIHTVLEYHAEMSVQVQKHLKSAKVKKRHRKIIAIIFITLG